MSPAIRALVRNRADGRCEYCRWPEAHGNVLFSVDHIVARKHHGSSSLDNLAWSCLRCNSHKRGNLTGIDPLSGAVVRIYDPRKNVCEDHFSWDGPEVVGRSEIGRATIDVLDMNGAARIEMRILLFADGITF